MSSHLGRRRFLSLGAVAAGGLVTASLAGCDITRRLTTDGEPGLLIRSALPLPEPYRVPLPVPRRLAPARFDGTTDYYEITQRPAIAEILPGHKTPLWTYEGTFPGPTIVSRAGRRTVVRHVNELPQPVVVHLHGGHTPHTSDGYPADMLYPVGHTGATTTAMPGMPGMTLPGVPTVGQRDYTYPLDQRAATLWYHDHRMGFTGESVWRGLAGFHLVHDDEEDRLPLPTGDRDIPLMIADRSFDTDGAMPYPAVSPDFTTPGVTGPYMNGVLGDVILVNGAPSPVADVQRLRYRFRILNASNARRYRLVLDPPPAGSGAFTQIGSDGGLLDRPRTHESIELASAERFDVVLDFARYPAGTLVRLRNTLGSGSTAEVMAFRVGAGNPADDTRIPDQLSRIETLRPEAARVTRTFLLQNRGDEGWTINGAAYDPAHPLAAPKLGVLERWRFVTDVHHPIHLHLDPFQVLSRNDDEPGPYDAGWKDTVDLRPAEAAEILVRFTDHPGRYVFHCHNLEHEDMAMMADFVVT